MPLWSYMYGIFLSRILHLIKIITSKRHYFEITVTLLLHPWWCLTLQWRHKDSVSNHQPRDCLLNRIFRHRSKKISKLRVTGLCARNSPVIGEFPAQIASNAENVSIWWRHHNCNMLFAFQQPFVKEQLVTSGFHSQGGSDPALWCFLLSCWINSRFVGDVRRHDVIVMTYCPDLKNERRWLTTNIEHHDSNASNGQQGDLPYCTVAILGIVQFSQWILLCIFPVVYLFRWQIYCFIINTESVCCLLQMVGFILYFTNMGWL